MTEALIFDLDGTIVQRATDNRACSRAMAAIYAQHGLSVRHEDLYEKWTTSPVPLTNEDMWLDLAAALGRDVDHDARARLLPLMIELAVDGNPVEAMPGAASILRVARDMGLRIGLATGSPVRWARAALQRNGLLDAFDRLCCSEDAVGRKPSPDIYLAAMSALAVDASRAVAFEDSWVGVASAKAAGLACVGVGAGESGEDLSEADVRIESFEAVSLAEVLAAVGAS